MKEKKDSTQHEILIEYFGAFQLFIAFPSYFLVFFFNFPPPQVQQISESLSFYHFSDYFHFHRTYSHLLPFSSPLLLTSSSSHAHPHILIITSSSSHPHHHIFIITFSSSHSHHHIFIITSSSSHLHHHILIITSSAQYFVF